jgi:hypothetical protein
MPVVPALCLRVVSEYEVTDPLIKRGAFFVSSFASVFEQQNTPNEELTQQARRDAGSSL